MQEGCHLVDMGEEKRGVKGEPEEQELLESAELDWVKGESLKNEKDEEQEEVVRVEQAQGKLKRVVEKKLKWKIEIVEEEGEKREESNENGEEEEEDEEGEEEEQYTNQISFANQDIPGVNTLQNKSEGAKLEKGKRGELEKKVRFGWREALAFDPLLANLHQKLDHIFFPKSRVCQVPFEM